MKFLVTCFILLISFMRIFGSEITVSFNEMFAQKLKNDKTFEKYKTFYPVKKSFEKLNNTDKIIIYPNPVSDQIVISSTANIFNIELTVNNYLGEVISVYKCSELNINNPL